MIFSKFLELCNSVFERFQPPSFHPPRNRLMPEYSPPPLSLPAQAPTHLCSVSAGLPIPRLSNLAATSRSVMSLGIYFSCRIYQYLLPFIAEQRPSVWIGPVLLTFCSVIYSAHGFAASPWPLTSGLVFPQGRWLSWI